MPEDVYKTDEMADGENFDMDYSSDPVDPEHPGFGSLLSALKAFHEGQIGADALIKYHEGLSIQLEESSVRISEMEVKEGAEDLVNLSLGSLTFAWNTLDRLGDYIEDPSPENLGNCVESLLRARGAAAYVDKILEKNISGK